jgi:hypothetical protein
MSLDIVGTWERFLDSLATEGGHIVVLLCLMLVLAWCAAHGSQKAEGFMEGLLTTLAYAMRGSGHKVN